MENKETEELITKILNCYRDIVFLTSNKLISISRLNFKYLSILNNTVTLEFISGIVIGPSSSDLVIDERTGLSQLIRPEIQHNISLQKLYRYLDQKYNGLILKGIYIKPNYFDQTYLIKNRLFQAEIVRELGKHLVIELNNRYISSLEVQSAFGNLNSHNVFKIFWYNDEISTKLIESNVEYLSIEEGDKLKVTVSTINPKYETPYTFFIEGFPIPLECLKKLYLELLNAIVFEVNSTLLATVNIHAPTDTHHTLLIHNTE